jgi:hypothetical protein
MARLDDRMKIEVLMNTGWWFALAAAEIMLTAELHVNVAPSTPLARTTMAAGQRTTSPPIIGYLETRQHVVTLYTDSLYSVATKDGKPVAEKVSLEFLQANFPELHRVIRTGVAMDASIWDSRR